MADLDLSVLKDGGVQGVFEASFKVAIEVSQLQDLRAIAPLRIQMPFQMDACIGQRAGLVGAQDVHAAQVMNGGELLYDDVLSGHAECAARERYRDNHRQEFRRQPDRECNGEEKRLEEGAMEQRIDEKHKSTSSTVKRMINMPKLCVPSSKAVGGALVTSESATLPTAVSAPIWHTIALAIPLITDVPMKTAFSA